MPVIQPQFNKKDIRSYAIRTGRITPGQERALAEQWPLYGLDLFQGAQALDGAFERQQPLVVEIGFGMGDSLVQMAASQPESNFIGIEVHVPGVGRLMNESHKRGLKNLRVFCADAIDVLNDCIADNTLARLQLYFPDPWHKSKHHKRRIVQAAFVELVANKLQAGGIFHLATDWQPYAESMLEVVSECQRLENLAGAGQYSPRPDYRPETKFERRGQRLGHGVWDLLFQKPENT